MVSSTLLARSILLGVVVAVMAGCGSQQKLENSFSVSPGMTKQEVIETMGDVPVATEFYGQLEEWHYCDTGMNGISKYVAIYFQGGRVYAMKPYSVVERDEGGNSLAVCEEFIKKGDYREPDIVREYRVRYR